MIIIVSDIKIAREDVMCKFFDKNDIASSVLDLISIFELQKPTKIICVGELSDKYVRSILTDAEIITLPNLNYLQNELDK